MKECTYYVGVNLFIICSQILILNYCYVSANALPFVAVNTSRKPDASRNVAINVNPKGIIGGSLKANSNGVNSELKFGPVDANLNFSVNGCPNGILSGSVSANTKEFNLGSKKIISALSSNAKFSIHVGNPDCSSNPESSDSLKTSSTTESNQAHESKELKCFSCNHLCKNQIQKTCAPQYDICVDVRYKDGNIDKECTNQKDYKNVWSQWAESHGGLKEKAQICNENLCNNKTVRRKELTCFQCNHLCKKETQKKCAPQYDICVDARYKDGNMDKDCTNENDYKNVWSQWAESHGGLKEKAHICNENLCNNKTVRRKELTCFQCNHLCKKETQKKCAPQYDICVDARYKDGNMDKDCTNENDYKNVWSQWAKSHGGLKEKAHICKQNLCNNKKIKSK